MPNYDIERSAARRSVLALGTFWATVAIAAMFMLIGAPVASFVATAVAFVPFLFLIGPIVRTVGGMNSSPSRLVRWIVAMVRATGWNPKLVGSVLTVPLVAFVGILIGLAITGGPDFTDADIPFDG